MAWFAGGWRVVVFDIGCAGNFCPAVKNHLADSASGPLPPGEARNGLLPYSRLYGSYRPPAQAAYSPLALSDSITRPETVIQSLSIMVVQKLGQVSRELFCVVPYQVSAGPTSTFITGF